MANLEFNQQELADLAGKLSTLDLTDQERALLLAIFAAAAERVNQTDVGVATLPQAGETGEEPTVEDLQQQLLNAYIPGNISFASITQPKPPSIHN
jgi:hypothetical protein